MLAALQSAMYARPAGGPTHFFYLDEFQHFARPDLVEFLSKAPAYNVGAVLANQNLAQLRQASGQALQETVAANAGTTVLLRCDTPDAEAFADRLPAHHGRAWTPGALASLPFGVGVAHTQGGAGYRGRTCCASAAGQRAAAERSGGLAAMRLHLRSGGLAAMRLHLRSGGLAAMRLHLRSGRGGEQAPPLGADGRGSGQTGGAAEADGPDGGPGRASTGAHRRRSSGPGGGALIDLAPHPHARASRRSCAAPARSARGAPSVAPAHPAPR